MVTGSSLPFLGILNKAIRLAKYEEIPNLSDYYTKDEIDDKINDNPKISIKTNVRASSGLSFSCDFRPIAFFGNRFDSNRDTYEWVEYIGSSSMGYYRSSKYSGGLGMGGGSYAIRVSVSGNSVSISGFETITQSRYFNFIVFG